MQRAKELLPAVSEGTHWNDAGMNRRLKDYRTRNPEAGNIQDFMRELIGPANVLAVEVQKPEDEQLASMKEIIEQKGKPCCINMITDSDRKFLANLENEARSKASTPKEEDNKHEEAVPEGEEAQPTPNVEEPEEEVDEISMLIEQEEREAHEAKVKEEEATRIATEKAHH